MAYFAESSMINLPWLLLLTFIGFLPSIIWLAFYLHEDVKPEPKKFVLFVFIAGMLSAFAAAVLEINIGCFITGECAKNGSQAIDDLKNATQFNGLIFAFVGVALSEEIVKYLAVYFTILRRKAFDEPVDAMIYMIVAALGFAAVENVFTVRLVASQGGGLNDIAAILTLRFLGATFLHTLSSGIVGYALARAFFSKRSHFILLVPSLIIAMIIHGLYNTFVGKTFDAELGSADFNYFFRSIIILLIGTGVALIILFQHLRQISAGHKFINVGDHAQEQLS